MHRIDAPEPSKPLPARVKNFPAQEPLLVAVGYLVRSLRKPKGVQRRGCVPFSYRCAGNLTPFASSRKSHGHG